MSVVISEVSDYHFKFSDFSIESQVLSRGKFQAKSCGSQHLATSEVTVNGGEFGDIPANYRIPPPQANELIVVGNYVHKFILPGFKYRVRKNGTDKFLFNGQALFLQSVGQGYGKRLSFESDDVLCNENMFWSDSNEQGYAFSIVALEEGTVHVHNCEEILLTKVNRNQEVIRSFLQGTNFYMEVRVEFEYQRAQGKDDTLKTAEGTVMLMRKKGQRKARVVSFNC